MSPETTATITRARRPAAVVAAVAATWCVVVLVAGLLPGRPTADVADVVFLPPFLAVFPVWAVTIVVALSERDGWAAANSGFPIPLRGWRIPAAVVAAVACFAIGMGAMTAGPAGQPVEEGGRYYVSNHGDQTGLTREEWEVASVRSAAGFLGVALLFHAMAVLYLTQAPVSEPRPAPRARRRPPWGRRPLEIVAPGSPDEVIARLATVTPVERVGGSGDEIHIVAEWATPQRAFDRPYPVRLEGTVVRRDTSGSVLAATVGPLPGRAAMDALTAAIGLVVAIVGPFVIGAALPLPIRLVSGLFLLAIAGVNGSSGPRAVGRAPGPSSRPSSERSMTGEG